MVGRLSGDKKYINLSRFLAFYLFCALGGSAVVLINTDGDVRDNFLFSFVWVFLHFSALLQYLWYVNKSDKVALSLLICFCSYALLTSVFSPVLATSLLYGGMLAMNAIFAFLVARVFNLRSLLRLLFYVLLVMVALSLLAYALGYSNVLYVNVHGRPTLIGTDPIRGFFAHKVMAALYANVGILLAVVLFSGRKKWFSIALFFVFILMTGSATGALLMPIGGCILVMYRWLMRKRFTSGAAHFVILGTIFLGGLGASLIVAPLLEFLGRDLTLTGRTLLWAWGWEAWLERPIFGWGFLGYFSSDHYESIRSTIPSFWDYDVPHFHNSLIQTSVDFGGIGAVFLVFNIFYCISTLYKAALLRRNEGAFAALVVLVLFFAASSTMHLFYNYNHAVTFLILVFLFRCVGCSRRLDLL